MSIKEDSSNWTSHNSDNELAFEELATATEYDIVHIKEKSTGEYQIFNIYFSEELYKLMEAKRFSKGIIKLHHPGGIPLQSDFSSGWTQATHKIGDATKCYARKIKVNTAPRNIEQTNSLLHDAIANFIHG